MLSNQISRFVSVSNTFFQFKFNLHRLIMQMYIRLHVARFISLMHVHGYKTWLTFTDTTNLACSLVKQPLSFIVQVHGFKKVLQTPPQRGTKDLTKHFLPGPDSIASTDLFFSPTLWSSTTPYKHLPLVGICVTWSMQTKWTICANQKSCVHINGSEMGQECCNWFRCGTHCRGELRLELQSEIPHYSTTWTGPPLNYFAINQMWFGCFS